MSRLDLSTALHQLCENVYFQPPQSLKLQYPCVVYSLKLVDSDYADNLTYKTMREYSLVYISPNPDPIYEESGDGMIETILKSFSHIKHVNRYTSDNLYHDAFNLFY